MIRNIGPAEIAKLFKNKYPLLMIDYITEVEPGEGIKGYKNFSNNEYFFPAHFKGNPNVPGSILLEAMLDMFVMSIVSLPDVHGKETADVRVDKLLFKRRVVPGERLDIECKVESFRRGIATGKAVGRVNGKLACSCSIVICVPDLMIHIKKN